MAEETLVLASSASSSLPTDTKSTTDDKEGDKENPTVKYVLYGIATVCLFLLAYYAYNRFQDNKSDENFVEGNRQERDDPIADYNLHEAVQELEEAQKKITSRLSDDTGL
jgi:cytochrome c-type biogenesis protein CcmH/NrfG